MKAGLSDFQNKGSGTFLFFKETDASSPAIMNLY